MAVRAQTDTEFAFDILRWLDRLLIRLVSSSSMCVCVCVCVYAGALDQRAAVVVQVSKFATYNKDDPGSFQLSPVCVFSRLLLDLPAVYAFVSYGPYRVQEFSYYPQFMFNLRRRYAQTVVALAKCTVELMCLSAPVNSCKCSTAVLMRQHFTGTRNFLGVIDCVYD